MLRVRIYRDHITRKMGRFDCPYCHTPIESPLVAQQRICWRCYKEIPYMGQLFYFLPRRVDYHRTGMYPLVPEVRSLNANG